MLFLRTEVGPFTEIAEVYNGRVAMLGFVGYTLIEVISHKPVLSIFGLVWKK